MRSLEQLLEENHAPLWRFVRYTLREQDAEDVMQEILLAAFRAFPTLKDEGSFRPWLFSIARHKCRDCLRRRYRHPEAPLTDAQRIAVLPRRFAPARDNLVEDALSRMTPQDRTLLEMVYVHRMPQQQVALRLGIPHGTVKSRLHAARGRFRSLLASHKEGERPMKHTQCKQTVNPMPMRIPAYTITATNLPPFECRWEELMGWFIVPREGEALSFAMYDRPEGLRTEGNSLRVTGRATVHGLEGVEVEVETHDPMPMNAVDDSGYVQRSFVAQLTDTHCRILSETHTENGVKHLYTFLDADEFIPNWGFGENNCGNETHLRARGDILRTGSTVTTADKEFLLDVTDRCTVEIGGKTYDTIRVMDVETYEGGVATEQFIDRNGRTVLWRRFNQDNWKVGPGEASWSQKLPASERLTINGRTYVHWYDCITTYIL